MKNTIVLTESAFNWQELLVELKKCFCLFQMV